MELIIVKKILLRVTDVQLLGEEFLLVVSIVKSGNAVLQKDLQIALSAMITPVQI